MTEKTYHLMEHATPMKAYAWLRRGQGNYDDLPSDDFWRATAYTMRRLWPDYLNFRARLAEIAKAHEPLPYWDGAAINPTDWLCPIDDDDWHAPHVANALAQLPPDIDAAWWDIAAIRWTPPTHYRERWRHTGRILTGTCGYALRFRAIPTPDDPDRVLIRDDHIYFPNHAVRRGLKIAYLPIVAGLWNVTPASMSAAEQAGGLPAWPTPEDLDEILAQPLPSWAKAGAEQIAELLRTYRRNPPDGAG